MVETLLQAGADASIKSTAGETPGQLAGTEHHLSHHNSPGKKRVLVVVRLHKARLAQMFGAHMGQQMLKDLAASQTR